MAKSSKTAFDAGEIVTTTLPCRIPVKGGAWDREVYVAAGTAFTVVPDGTGAPVDDLSKTAWQSYAPLLITEGTKLGMEVQENG